MKTIILLFVIITVSAPLKIYSQENNHPIDKFLESCMEKEPSTAGMVN